MTALPGNGRFRDVSTEIAIGAHGKFRRDTHKETAYTSFGTGQHVLNGRPAWLALLAAQWHRR
eukprot:COSAG02_NODE_53967_length_298_cov_1.683417_1_plen_62_part_10